MSNSSYDFVPPFGYQHLEKIHSHTFFAFPEILGGYFHPLDAIKLSENADAINY